jgi:hypothetical protein
MKKLYFVIGMIMVLLLVGCSDTGNVSYRQETKSSTETSVETSTETVSTLTQYEVEDTLSRNCYQAFHAYVNKLKDTEWVGFQLIDFDGDKTDELIAINQDAENLKEDKQRYFIMDWEDHKITVTEMDLSTVTPLGKPLNKLEYDDRDSILTVLSTEGKRYFDGVTKKEKDLFQLVVGLVWLEEGWADEEKEQRDAMEDYLVVSGLGEKTDYKSYDPYLQRYQFQYKMPTAEVIEFYKDVFGVERAYSEDYYITSKIGVMKWRSDGYLYALDSDEWSDYFVISDVKRNGNELTIHALAWNSNTKTRLAEMTVSMATNDGKYGYVLQGYEVAKDEGIDPRSGQELKEFQAEDVQIQYIMGTDRSSGMQAPVIRDLRYRENDKEQFTANAKRLLTELKKEYEADPGEDGSNIAAKSTLLASYDFADNSKILIYEDAVYGSVPPETGTGSEYGYYLNYCIMTPGNPITNGEIFRYNESFGEMPAHRNGTSTCRHYYLGCDWEGKPAVGTYVYAANAADFAEEFMFYASVGRNHDMTVDEEGWERYDEDYYINCAYFRPDGTRIINMFDTWQIATLEYVSHGTFIKTPKGEPLFEQRYDQEGCGYYVEGKKLTLKQKPEDTVETFCDIALDETTKLRGQINYRKYENLIDVDLVFNVDGVEVRHNLWSYVTYWE